MKKEFRERIKRMEEGREITEEKNLEGDAPTALQPAAEILPPPEFVKVEKNLASLGFFTPSSKRLRNAQEKTFTITTVENGQRIELKGSIIPSAKYGLPITADQDKWIALCKILSDIIRKEGRVTNPVSFTSAEILRLLHKHRHSGKNYREIEEWLDVLFSTTIFSEGVVYLAGEKRRGKDRYRVFDRAVSFGKELSDGKVADKNYVWFSDWQLQNINNNHLLPIDLEAYRGLKNHIAKAFVPLLQIWLYATRNEGVFEKRYDELCSFLNIQRYPYRSQIVRTLGPSLDELKRFGYLSDWQIESTSDDEGYKVVFHHGEKFHRDRNARLKRGTATNPKSDGIPDPRSDGPAPSRALPSAQMIPPVAPSFDPQLVGEFTRRGITERKANELLAILKPGQDVLAQLELIDGIVAHPANQVKNPPGFYVRLIEANTPIPDGFETAAKRKLREEREAKERERRAAADARQEQEWEYEAYRDTEIDRYIAANQAAFEALKEAKWKEDRERHSFATESMARLEARYEMAKQVTFLTFEEFMARKRDGGDLLLKPVATVPEPEAIRADGAEAGEPDPPVSNVSAIDPAPSAATPEAPAVPPAAPEPVLPEPIILFAHEPPMAEGGQGSGAELV